MRTEAIAQSPIGKLFIRALAAGMESGFRYRFFSPVNILRGTEILTGGTVLEVGCGTGYFTLPAARLIGDKGYIVAIDVLADSVELVSHKVHLANLKNVRVMRADALNTHLDAESFDTVLLFGVVPAPMLPMNKLLPEMHRVLKREGRLAVWPPVPSWLPGAVVESGLFKLTTKRNGVHNFKRC